MVNPKSKKVAYWTLHGRLAPDNRFKCALGILTAHPPRKALEDAPSELRIELLDKDGRLLLSQKVPTSFYCPEKSEIVPDLAVRTKVPFHDDTKTICLWNGDVLVKEWQRPDAAPIIEDLTVKRIQGRVHLKWQAQHSNNSAMQYVVRFSTDGGCTFNRLSRRLDTPGYEVAENEIPGGKGWIFQVAATDGVNTSTVDSPPIDLPDTPPLVEIASPPDGQKVSFSTRVVYEGNLITYLGQDVSVKSVTWASDRDGKLSDQLTFAGDKLSQGAHKITLTIVDNHNRSLAASISLQVSQAVGR